MSAASSSSTTTSLASSSRDLLECVWPAAITTAQQPFKSHTWVAALHVIMTRDGGDFARTRRLGPARFEHAVRKELTRRGKIRPCLRIVRKLYAALADPAGVIAHRPGAFERIGWLLEDWGTARTKLADTEIRMATVLDDLQLTEPDPVDPAAASGHRPARVVDLGAEVGRMEVHLLVELGYGRLAEADVPDDRTACSTRVTNAPTTTAISM